MTNESRSGELRYLPIEVSGQLYAIPMADLLGVHRAGEEAVVANAPTSTDGSLKNSVPVIDLQHLFWGQTSSNSSGPVITVATEVGACALRVGGVRPMNMAPKSAQSAIPRLVAGDDCPFMGVIHEPDSLVLIVDCQRLVKRVQQVAPELIVDLDYVI